MTNQAIKEIQKLLANLSDEKSETIELTTAPPELPFKIGKAYLIRTVTMYYTGRVTGIVGKFLELEDSAWIPDAGRWHEAVIKGTFSEVEPMGDSIVNSDAILDAVEISYALPTSVK